MAVGDVTEPGRIVVVSGLAGAGTAEAALRNAVGGVLQGETVDWQLRTFDNPLYCQALDIISDIAARKSGLAPTFDIALPGQRQQLVTDEILKLDVTMPPAPSWLQVEYLQSDGKVWHMIPSTDEVARLFPANAHATIGEPRKGWAGWGVSAPYGRDMIIAVASAKPLFATKRPQEEDGATYLAALQSAIRAARNERLSADALVLDTVEKH